MRQESFHAEAQVIRTRSEQAAAEGLRKLSRRVGDTLPVRHVRFGASEPHEPDDDFAEQAKEALSLMSPGMAKALALMALEAPDAPPLPANLAERAPHALAPTVAATERLLESLAHREPDALEQALYDYEQAFLHLTPPEQVQLDAFFTRCAETV